MNIRIIVIVRQIQNTEVIKMKKPTIKTTVQDGVTMVWYLLNGVAVCADVEKQPAGWSVRFRDQRSYCHKTKAEAMAIAKRWVKASI